MKIARCSTLIIVSVSSFFLFTETDTSSNKSIIDSNENSYQLPMGAISVEDAHKHEKIEENPKFENNKEKRITKNSENIVDENKIAKKNIELLSMYTNLSDEEISEELTSATASNKKLIKKIFYGTSEKKSIYVDQNNFNQLESILILYSDGSTEEHPLTLEEETQEYWVDFVSFPIIQFNVIGQVENELIAILESAIQTTDLDSILNQFGGRYSVDVAYGSPNYVLGELQIGDNKKIDSIQLDWMYESIQLNAKESAKEMINSFPELAKFHLLPQNEKNLAVQDMRNNASKYIMTYAFTKRWFNYSIGGVEISQLMYAGGSIFSEDSNQTDMDVFNGIVSRFEYHLWPETPGNPLTFPYFIEHLLFNNEYGMRGLNLGFNGAHIENENGIPYISSLLEYLIRTFENTTDYNGWLEDQGFVTSIDTLENQSYLDGGNSSHWDGLKAIESKTGNLLSPAIMTILLSVPSKNEMMLGRAANVTIFAHATSFGGEVSETPQELIYRYSKEANNFTKFILDVGTETQVSKMKETISSKYVSIWDAGERIGTSAYKDFFNPNYTYIHFFLQAVSPYHAIKATESGINAVAMSNPSRIVFGVGDLRTEYTISHEMTHIYQGILSDGTSRVNLENTATISENPAIYGQDVIALNYYYNSTGDRWNQSVPENSAELEAYTKNYLDLIYAWNIEKANILFSSKNNEFDRHIYQLRFDEQTKATFAERLSSDEIQNMKIYPEDPNFLTKLVENKIILPANINSDKIEYTSGESYASGSYSKIPTLEDAFFYFPYTGSDFSSGTDRTSMDGWNHVWGFESMGQSGLKGYSDFYGGEGNDLDALRDNFGIDNPEKYLVSRYSEVQKLVENNRLKLHTLDDITLLIHNNIKNDKKAKVDFAKLYLKETNSLFDGIYSEIPELPIDPEKTSLSFNHISDFNFGTMNISGNDKSYFAKLAESQNEDGSSSEIPNYISFNDNRKGSSNWSLNVKQESQLKTSDNIELEGSKLTLLNIVQTSTISSHSNPNQSLTVGEEIKIAENKKDVNGTWNIIFGDVNNSAFSIRLDVPGNSKKLKETYTTTLTWNLVDSPL